MSKYSRYICFFIFSTVALVVRAETDVLKNLASKYRSTPLVKMAVIKTLKSDLMNKETSHEGRIFLAENRFRWENDKPEKTLLVFDGKLIWSEQTPPPELGGPIQVAKGEVSKNNGAQILISSLVGGDFTKNFKIKKEVSESLGKRFHLDPVNKQLNVTKLSVLIDTKKIELKEVSYFDDIGNETHLKFSKIEFVNKANDNLFRYKLPKGAQVTNL